MKLAHKSLLSGFCALLVSACLGPEEIVVQRKGLKDAYCSSESPADCADPLNPPVDDYLPIPTSAPGASPTPAPPGNVSLVGYATFNSSSGLISGYAYDNFNVSRVISVEIYVDAPRGTGTLLGTTAANEPAPSLGGNVGFSFQPAAPYTNGAPRRLYLYMIDPTSATRVAFPGTPYTYLAGADADGRDYFNANVRPILISSTCSGCHANLFSDYFSVRQYLANPSILDGGTPTNNAFIRKIRNQIPHSGGNRCSVSPELCTNVEEWFRRDFGQ